jgi:hypothetical protein
MLKDHENPEIRQFIIIKRINGETYNEIAEGLKERGFNLKPIDCFNVFKYIVENKQRNDIPEELTKKLLERFEKRREEELQALILANTGNLRQDFLKDKVNHPLNEKDALKWLIIEKRIRGRLRTCMKKYSTLRTNEERKKKYYQYLKLINFKEIVLRLLPDFPKNIKEYEIDHIIPCCSFDFDNYEDVLKCFHPLNHRWLKGEDNWKKAKEDKRRKLKR